MTTSKFGDSLEELIGLRGHYTHVYNLSAKEYKAKSAKRKAIWGKIWRN